MKDEPAFNFFLSFKTISVIRLFVVISFRFAPPITPNSGIPEAFAVLYVDYPS
jgi:hypothetical protein